MNWDFVAGIFCGVAFTAVAFVVYAVEAYNRKS